MPFVSRFDYAAGSFQQTMRGSADLFVGIDHQHSLVRQLGTLLRPNNELTVGIRDGFSADQVDVFLDFSRMSQNRSQSFGHVRVVPDITFDRVDGVVENFIQRKSNRIPNRLDTF